MRSKLILASVCATLLCSTVRAQDVDIAYQKFVLDNGLEVIVHEDHSDPVVAVYVYYHVGSAREERGRSGFAHLFEHMLFQGSEHVGDDQHFKYVSEAGGTLNGTTNNDRTNYFEVLPSNQLEVALWLEADRMGFLLPAMTQAKLDNQRDVVKNERRQNYENRPYGQAEGAIAAALYPPDHPYSWLTIGSHEDLSAASLDDVKGFFSRWYGPNNATLAIGGDIATDKALALVKKYFGPIPRGPEVAKPATRPARLDESKYLVMEDKVKLPELSYTYPAVPQFSADEPALDFLASILSANKSAVLDRALMIEADLASQVSASSQTEELAGVFNITVRANPGVSLEVLDVKVRELLAKLAKDGIDPEQLQRVKNRYEAGFVRRMETVGSRTSTLANYNTFLGDPAYYKDDLARHLAVTTEDVARVLKRYVLDRPAIVMSVVPDKKRELALPEPKQETPKASVAADTTPLDRTQKPAAGETPQFRAPGVWHDKLANGVQLVGTPYKELPMTTLALAVPAGRVYESMKTLGLSSITADLMDEGTRSLSAIEFTQALDRLGASINVNASEDEITISLSCLDKYLPEAIALLSEVVLHPRFSDDDFRRIKKERLVSIDTRADQIRTIASDVYRRLLWGDSVMGRPSIGTKDTVTAFTLDDVKSFWREHVVPAGARMTYVGKLDAEELQRLLSPLIGEWKSSAPVVAAAAKRNEFKPPAITGTHVYLVDKPGAAQSEVRIGHLSVSSTDADYYPLTVLNFPLGGTFSSRINMNLREDKGYTYGARSSFDGGLLPGAFTTSGGVKTDVTKASIVEFMKELDKIGDGLTAAELAFAKQSLVQSANRQYESMGALLGMLDNIGQYGYRDDYVTTRLKQLETLSLDELKALAAKYIHPKAMIILVVGDKARIGKSLAELGYGEVIELDIDGKPVGGS